MRLYGRGIWQKCKYLIAAAVFIHAVQLIWVYFIASDHSDSHNTKRAKLANQQTGIAMDTLRRNLELLNKLAQNSSKIEALPPNLDKIPEQLLLKNSVVGQSHPDDVCTPIVPYRDVWPDAITTFDLPEVANYTLDARGKYFLQRKDTKQAEPKADDTVHVTLVPFSHADPGYGMTMEGYYQSMTKNVLDLMVDKLSIYRNMTFQWAETVFLERWFRDITPARKEQVRDLVRRGQLEIVLGGWVMPDEAVTRFEPVVGQLIEGHQWLAENLGVTPENAWINDPFGYSSTMPYLWKASGIENMVILRIHQAVKAHLMSRNSLEYMWRPYWEKTTKSDILCSLMSYEGYWNSDVCGPKQEPCKLFNFLHLERHDSGARAVDATNIQHLSQTLYENYRFTASLYKFNHLVIFLGEDNSYSNERSWDDTFNNYGKLMQNINSNSDMKMQIEFGTIGTYFKRLRKAEKRLSEISAQGSFPVLSGDFFPYSDWENAYWTGYFTTRSWLKRFSRELESVLRSADIFSVIAYNHCLVTKLCTDISRIFSTINSELRTARRELGMFQHHDGITGTSLPFVVQDYEMRLNTGYQSAYKALKLALLAIETNGKVQSLETLTSSSPRISPQQWVPGNEYALKGGKLMLLIANPMERQRTEVVCITLRSKNLRIFIAGNPGIKLPYQITVPSVQRGSQAGPGVFLIAFSVKLQPFVSKAVVIEETSEQHSNKDEVHETPVSSSASDIIIENMNMKVTFYAQTGMLKSVTDHQGKKTQLDAEFLRYKSKSSGAYLFGPEGSAENIKELESRPTLLLTKGPIYSELRVSYAAGFVQTVKLYNTSAGASREIHVQNLINLKLSPDLSNSEIIWRLKTDVDNGQIFFTDQNGYQYLGRKTYPDRLIESNFYPLTTMAFIEDESRRLSLHAAQPHGVASLAGGWLEVMLDRNMAHDDKRGLGMGVPDKVITVSDFIIQIEQKEQPGKLVEQRFNYASVSNVVTNEKLQNPINIFSVVGESGAFGLNDNADAAGVILPCDIEIAGLRNLVTNDLKYNGTSLILHRKSISCAFRQTHEHCDAKRSKVTFSELRLGLLKSVLPSNTITETSLSHLHFKKAIDLNEDIRPDKQALRSFILKSA